MCADSIRNDDVSIQLIPHPSGRSTRWYIRVYVPKEFQHLVGKTEVRRSTGTSNSTEARAVGARLEASLRAEWRQLAKSNEIVRLTPSVIAEICASRVTNWRMTDDDARIEVGFDAEEEQEARAHSDSTIQYMSSVLARGPKSEDWPHVREMAIEYAVDVGYNIAQDDPLLPKFVRAFAQAEKSTQEVISRRNDGTDASFVVPETLGTKLSEMIEPYEKHHKGSLDEKTISKSVSIWRRLIEFLNDCPLNDVTSKDIYDFLHSRLYAATDFWSQRYVDGHAKRSLNAIFSLARTQQRMQAKNPVDSLEVTPKLPKEIELERQKPRHAFSAQQLNTLFASNWYDPSSDQWKGKMATDLAGRYWAPLISTCHGLRVREVMQLVNSDFSFEGDILFVAFQVPIKKSKDGDNDQDGDSGEHNNHDLPKPKRKLKNKAAHRTIPIHSKLLELGIADFVREMLAQHPEGTPMFSSSLPEAGGKSPLWGRSYEQAFLRHVRDTLQFGHGYCNHSFRHQFEDRVRYAQAKRIAAWPAGIGEVLSGRKLPRDIDKHIFREQSSAREYGNGYVPHHLIPFLEEISFEGITFPPPYSEWVKQDD